MGCGIKCKSMSNLYPSVCKVAGAHHLICKDHNHWELLIPNIIATSGQCLLETQLQHRY